MGVDAWHSGSLGPTPGVHMFTDDKSTSGLLGYLGGLLSGRFRASGKVPVSILQP